MNERIRELAEQAKCYADENNAHYLQNPHWIETFEEKFAELIVRECADLCMKYDTCEDIDKPLEHRKGRHFYTIIKKHFGVE